MMNSSVKPFSFMVDFAEQEAEKERSRLRAIEEQKRQQEELRLAEINRITEADLEKARAEGFAAGKEEGEQQTQEALQQVFQTHLAPLLSRLSELDAYKQHVAASLEIRAITFLEHALEKIIPDMMEKYPSDALRYLLKELLTATNQDTDLVFSAHPESLGLLKALAEGEALLKNKNVRFQEDNSLPQGEFHLQWQQGRAAASLETAYSTLEKLLSGGKAALQAYADQMAEKDAQEAAAPTAHLDEASPDTAPQQDLPHSQEKIAPSAYFDLEQATPPTPVETAPHVADDSPFTHTDDVPLAPLNESDALPPSEAPTETASPVTAEGLTETMASGTEAQAPVNPRNINPRIFSPLKKATDEQDDTPETEVLKDTEPPQN